MKLTALMFAAIWTGTIGGVTVEVTDLDHPGYFESEAECRAHVHAATADLQAAIAARFPELEVRLAGFCARARPGK